MGTLRFTAILLLAFAVAGELSAEPAARPATVTDAIASGSGTGWSTVTLADGRPTALYRSDSGTSLALGCRADGVIVVAGGPARVARLVSEHEEEIVPLALDHTSHRGALNLAWMLQGPDNAAGRRLFLDAEEIPLVGASPHVSGMDEYCGERHIQSRPARDDVVSSRIWSGSPGHISLSERGDESRLGFTCDEATRRLRIHVPGAPRNARAGQQATIVVATPTGRFTYRGRVEPNEGGAVELWTIATVTNGPVLLNVLSSEDGFAAGIGNSVDEIYPARGLAGLIERHLAACR